MQSYSESATEATAEEIGLLDSLDGEWLKLPVTIMRDCGPAVQTLGALLKVTSGETYIEQAEIAARARLPLRTVRRHLATLHDRHWINNCGRQRTRSGRPRRTATIKVTGKTRVALDEYGILPWWACCGIRNLRGRRGGRLPWSAKAVLSVIMAQMAKLKRAAEEQGYVEDAEGDPDSVECFFGDHFQDRFEFSLTKLQGITALGRDSLVRAKRSLAGCGVVEWIEENPADSLMPSWDFRVVVTPAGDGRCYLDFGGQ